MRAWVNCTSFSPAIKCPFLIEVHRSITAVSCIYRHTHHVSVRTDRVRQVLE